MIALLANPAAPFELRVDVPAFTTTQSLSELIWQLHQIIANPASNAEEVRVAKRQMLHVIREREKTTAHIVGLCNFIAHWSRIKRANCDACRSIQEHASRAVI